MPSDLIKRKNPSAVNAGIIVTLAIASIIAVFSGMLLSVGFLLPIGLIAAAVVGSILLFNPRKLFWLSLVFSLVICGCLEFFAGIGQANWIASILAAAMLPATALIHNAQRRQHNRNNGGFIVLILLYIFTLLLGSIVNKIPLNQFIVGMRSYLPYIGVAAILASGIFSKTDGRRIVWGVMIIALIQWPFAVFELLLVGPWRQTLRGAVGREDEVVVGTFGGNLITGGYTGEMAVFLVTALAFTFSLWHNKQIRTKTAVLFGLGLFLPILLAETKIAFLLFPVLIFVVAHKSILANGKSLFSFIIVVAAFLAALGMVYTYKYWDAGGPGAMHDFTYSFDPDFMVSETHRGRVRALIHWYDNHIHKNFSIQSLFGHGVASTLESSMTIGEGSAVQYYGLGLDAHAANRLLWDNGLIGFIAFLTLLLRQIWVARKMAITTTSDVDRPIIWFLCAGLVACLSILPYQVSTFGGSAMQFLLWFFIGMTQLYQNDREPKETDNES